MSPLKLVLVVTLAAGMASGEYVGHLGHLDHLGHFITKRAVLLDSEFVPVPPPAAAPGGGGVAVSATAGPRQPRETPYGHAPVAKSGYGRGRVGPVYTFVK
ncbi:hypothetical protein OTU49_006469, partial [Cherax quadricarinatus]